MERVLLLLDDLDDLFGAFGLLVERVRRLFLVLAKLVAVIAIATCGVLAGKFEPPVGLAVAILLFVFLLYRGVTRPRLVVRSRRATG